MMQVLGELLLMVGGTLLALAAWGVIVLPDALARQHAATKAGTLALSCVCVGALLIAGEWAWAVRLLMILALLLATLPVASHLLARAAIKAQGLTPDVDAAASPPPAPTPVHSPAHRK